MHPIAAGILLFIFNPAFGAGIPWALCLLPAIALLFSALILYASVVDLLWVSAPKVYCAAYYNVLRPWHASYCVAQMVLRLCASASPMQALAVLRFFSFASRWDFGCFAMLPFIFPIFHFPDYFCEALSLGAVVSLGLKMVPNKLLAVLAIVEMLSPTMGRKQRSPADANDEDADQRGKGRPRKDLYEQEEPPKRRRLHGKQAPWPMVTLTLAALPYEFLKYHLLQNRKSKKFGPDSLISLLERPTRRQTCRYWTMRTWLGEHRDTILAEAPEEEDTYCIDLDGLRPHEGYLRRLHKEGLSYYAMVNKLEKERNVRCSQFTMRCWIEHEDACHSHAPGSASTEGLPDSLQVLSKQASLIVFVAAVSIASCSFHPCSHCRHRYCPCSG